MATARSTANSPKKLAVGKRKGASIETSKTLEELKKCTLFQQGVGIYKGVMGTTALTRTVADNVYDLLTTVSNTALETKLGQMADGVTAGAISTTRKVTKRLFCHQKIADNGTDKQSAGKAEWDLNCSSEGEFLLQVFHFWFRYFPPLLLLRWAVDLSLLGTELALAVVKDFVRMGPHTVALNTPDAIEIDILNRPPVSVLNSPRPGAQHHQQGGAVISPGRPGARDVQQPPQFHQEAAGPGDGEAASGRVLRPRRNVPVKAPVRSSIYEAWWSVLLYFALLFYFFVKMLTIYVTIPVLSVQFYILDTCSRTLHRLAGMEEDGDEQVRQLVGSAEVPFEMSRRKWLTDLALDRAVGYVSDLPLGTALLAMMGVRRPVTFFRRIQKAIRYQMYTWCYGHLAPYLHLDYSYCEHEDPDFEPDEGSSSDSMTTGEDYEDRGIVEQEGNGMIDQNGAAEKTSGNYPSSRKTSNKNTPEQEAPDTKASKLQDDAKSCDQPQTGVPSSPEREKQRKAYMSILDKDVNLLVKGGEDLALLANSEPRPLADLENKLKQVTEGETKRMKTCSANLMKDNSDMPASCVEKHAADSEMIDPDIAALLSSGLTLNTVSVSPCRGVAFATGCEKTMYQPKIMFDVGDAVNLPLPDSPVSVPSPKRKERAPIRRAHVPVRASMPGSVGTISEDEECGATYQPVHIPEKGPCASNSEGLLNGVHHNETSSLEEITKYAKDNHTGKKEDSSEAHGEIAKGENYGPNDEPGEPMMSSSPLNLSDPKADAPEKRGFLQKLFQRTKSQRSEDSKENDGQEQTEPNGVKTAADQSGVVSQRGTNLLISDSTKSEQMKAKVGNTNECQGNEKSKAGTPGYSSPDEVDSLPKGETFSSTETSVSTLSSYTEADSKRLPSESGSQVLSPEPGKTVSVGETQQSDGKRRRRLSERCSNVDIGEAAAANI